MSNPMIMASEVAEIFKVSKRKGYSIIDQLNCELREKGYITIAGRVSRKYFFERTGLESPTENLQERNE